MYVLENKKKEKTKTRSFYLVYISKKNLKTPKWGLTSSYSNLDEIGRFFSKLENSTDNSSKYRRENFIYKISKIIINEKELPINEEVLLLRTKYGF